MTDGRKLRRVSLFVASAILTVLPMVIRMAARRAPEVCKLLCRGHSTIQMRTRDPGMCRHFVFEAEVI